MFLVKCAFSQSISNSLFLVVDKKTDSIRIDSKDSINFKYFHSNKTKNWGISLSHIYVPGADQNNYRYLLPKEMISELERKGNLEDIKPFLIKLNNYNNKEVSQFFSKHYSYYYEYLQKSSKKTYKRYNIFMIFKSDIANSNFYVPCYEVSLSIIRMVEQ